MEQKNLFVAIVLSIVVYMVWFQFFMPPKTVDPNALKSIEKNEKVETKKPVLSSFDPSKEVVGLRSDGELKTIKIDTPLYEAEITNRGAVIKQIKLKKYKETNKADSGLKYLMDKNLPLGVSGLSFKNNSLKNFDTAIFSPVLAEKNLRVTDKAETLSLVWKSEEGVIIEKKFEFSPDSYLINFQVIIKNGSAQDFNDNLVVQLQNRLLDKSNISFVGPSLFRQKEMVEVSVGDIEKENFFKGDIHWLAIQDRYFIMGLISKDGSDSEVNLGYDKASEIIDTAIVKETGIVAPGTQKEVKLGLYAGPKSISALKNIGNDMEKVVNFGMFDVIAKPCLKLMNMFYTNVVKNYGVAIILLTILFKIILWPLGSKSYRSMNDMRKLQPLVNQIREKHAGNKQKLNEEMMNLYKTYKVNPLSGCLPMIVQMPIFFAFYKMLYSAIELRHAHFFGWITDLSAPDRLFNLNFTIPYFDPPTGIPVLTLLMGGSMFLQQKMSPPAGDPAQAKMMMFMPVFMTFIFMNFSSGLVLYWLVNNIVSISQQYYIMKKNA